jgi:hypothetical protein
LSAGKKCFRVIFSIDEAKVNEKSKPAFLRYKQECYEALYDQFFLRIKLYEMKELEKTEASRRNCRSQAG